MKITYYFDGFGAIDESYEEKLRITGLNSAVEKEYIGFIYILNIQGSNVCKIGTSERVFDRMQAIRQIVKCVFPFIENSIAYNVFISKPVKKRFTLEKKLHNYFSKYNIDGEWFNCSYDEATEILQKTSESYISDAAVEHIEKMMNPSNYELHCINKELHRIKYLKCISAFGFDKYLLEQSPLIFDNNLYLISLEKLDLLCLTLENFVTYITSCTIASIDLDSRKLYAYKINAKKQIIYFIQTYRKDKKNENEFSY